MGTSAPPQCCWLTSMTLGLLQTGGTEAKNACHDALEYLIRLLGGTCMQ